MDAFSDLEPPWTRTDSLYTSVGYVLCVDDVGATMSEAASCQLLQIASELRKKHVVVLVVTANVCLLTKQVFAKHGVLVVEALNTMRRAKLASILCGNVMSHAVEILDTCDSNLGQSASFDLQSLDSQRSELLIKPLAGGVVTAVICSCTASQLNETENNFQACVCRLCNALQEGGIIPGAGLSEIGCIVGLKQLQSSISDSSSLLSICAGILMEALETFLSILLCNLGCSPSEALVLIQSTLTAWLQEGYTSAYASWHCGWNKVSGGLSAHEIIDSLPEKIGAMSCSLKFVHVLMMGIG